eukprot:1152198-Pelagomonas_calceolata.AAC.1
MPIGSWRVTGSTRLQNLALASQANRSYAQICVSCPVCLDRLGQSSHGAHKTSFGENCCNRHITTTTGGWSSNGVVVVKVRVEVHVAASLAGVAQLIVLPMGSRLGRCQLGTHLRGSMQEAGNLGPQIAPSGKQRYFSQPALWWRGVTSPLSQCASFSFTDAGRVSLPT